MYFRFDTQARVSTQHKKKSEWQVDVWCDKEVSMLSIKKIEREWQRERKSLSACRWCAGVSCTLNLMRLLISNLSVIREKWLGVRVSLMSIDDVDSMSIYTHHRFILARVSEKYHHSNSHSPLPIPHKFSLNHLSKALLQVHSKHFFLSLVTHSFNNKCWQMENLTLTRVSEGERSREKLKTFI